MVSRFVTDEQLTNWFAYHQPRDERVKGAHEQVRAWFLDLAFNLQSLLPECSDKTVALRKIREAMWAANATIACNKYEDEK